jgi:lipoprotein-anchoring transpeptidase ErfK/SrfK
MSNCENHCNEIKSTKNGYVPPAANCSKKCKKEIKKEELADIFLSNNEIVELSPANTEIGIFTNGINERGFFILHSDFAGQNDNDKFIIKDNKLKIKEILYYTPGITYKVTVRYSGLKHYKQKDFDIIITNSQDNSTPPAGTQVQVSSADNIVELTFENIITSGEVTFSPIDSTDGLFCDINTICDFDGDVAVSFNDPGIVPSNNPAIYHIKYDSELDQVFYDNVTTEVIEGKITGVVNSLGSFIVQFVPPPEGWGFPPSESLGFSKSIFGGLSCGTFNFNFQNPLGPCPGNQTRNGFSISLTNGTLSPFGSCGCWEDTGVTAEVILGAASAWSLAKVGVCQVVKTIASLKSSISSLKNVVSGLTSALAILQNGLRNIAGFIAKNQADVKYYTALNETAKALRVKAQQAIIKGQEALRTRFLNKNQRYNLEQEIKQAQEYVAGADKVIAENSGKIATAKANVKKYQDELVAKFRDEVNPKAKELAAAQKDLLDKQAALKAAQDSQPGLLAAVGTALAALYALVNTIKTQQTCPTGQTLHPQACVCCNTCQNGRVFINQVDCSCGCASDKEACTNQTTNTPGCYIPCTQGQIRTGDCNCITVISDCLGSCHYSYDYFFHEWHISGSGDCSVGCECPSDEYVNSNDQNSNGCSNAADCTDCVTNCVRL